MSDMLTLTSLALLKQQVDSGSDYYDYLVPFVEQVYVESPDEVCSPSEMQGILRADYGLEIPQQVVQKVLTRLVNRRALKSTNNKFSRFDGFSGRDLQPLVKDAERDIEVFLNKLVSHAKSRGHNDFDRNRAIDTVKVFLGNFSIECIKSYVQGTAIADLPKETEEWEKALVADLIVDIAENDRDLFNKFIVLVQGNMLANALISIDTETPPNKFKGITFYFDTPNVLHVLGYGKKEFEILMKEMTALITNLGARIAVFQHTIEEVERVFDGAITNIHNLYFSNKSLNVAARENGWKKSDLVIRKENLEGDLKKFGFIIKPTPTHVKEYQIDENFFEDLLKENVNYKYDTQTSKAIVYDVASARSIYVLRQGKRSSRLDESHAIMVTSNSAVARAAYAFTLDSRGEHGYSSFIKDSTLTNIAWLKRPSMTSGLINAQTMAMAYAALRIPDRELDDFLTQCDKLVESGEVNSRDLEILRSNMSNTNNDLLEAKISGKSLSDKDAVKEIIDNANADRDDPSLCDAAAYIFAFAVYYLSFTLVSLFIPQKSLKELRIVIKRKCEKYKAEARENKEK